MYGLAAIMSRFSVRRGFASRLGGLAAGIFCLCASLAVAGSSGEIAASPPAPPAAASAFSLAGQFLVASRRLIDSNFARTVIYMLEYSDQGAMGLIVNRVLGSVPYRKLLQPLGIGTRSKKRASLHLGGPVDIGRGFVLHTPDYKSGGARTLSQGIALSTDADILRAMAEGKGPRRARIALGYAGWAAGQLDHEMARGDWLVAPADPALIFSDDPASVWEKALKYAGISL